MKITDLLKKVLPHLVAILVMLIVSSLYFYPAIEGKSLQGHDVSMNYGKWREINDYKDFDGKRPLWNSILFSGMPEFLSTNYQGSDQLAKLFYLPQRLGLPVEVASLFWYMLGFYIMMIAFGPTIRFPHSPDEKVNIPSVEKFWDYLVETLKQIHSKPLA